MARVSKLLTDEIVSLAKSGLKKTDNLKHKLKLQAIIYAKKHGIKKVAKLYNISHSALIRWIHRLRNESLEGLNHKPKKSRSTINMEHQKTIKTWLNNNSAMTINSLRTKIATELGIEISKTQVYYTIQKLGFKYIGARPKNYKENQKSNSELKQSTQNHWRQI